MGACEKFHNGLLRRVNVVRWRIAAWWLRLFGPRERYSFLWRRVENDWDGGGEAEWDSRAYVGTLPQCCEQMYNWVCQQDDEVEIDYEAKAEHLSHCADRPHHELFPDLDFVDHPIKDLVP